MNKPFYITSAIPYVNARPHLGHLVEWVQADTIARWHQLLGEEVAFTCGTDENSLKNVQAAQKESKKIQPFLDEYAEIFQQAFRDFNISITHFGRGSDAEKHWPGVQALWERCNQSGDIYTKEYEGLYCVGCEAYYTKDELTEDGFCPEHLKPLESIRESNYFFKLSRYEGEIKRLIESDELSVIGPQYKAEMLGFINQGLEDFSISRTTQRSRGVGVPVPGDPSQVMYVWFDALNIYTTAIGLGYDQAEFEKYWPANVHWIGKGITRFHAVYWIGMLLSAHLPLPKTIGVHGYITVDGQKMSKSLGNVLDPYALVKEYGLEPIRYYLLRAIPTHGDGDFSKQRFIDVYTSELANGLGNVSSRITKLASSVDMPQRGEITLDEVFNSAMQSYALDEALEMIVSWEQGLDKWLTEIKPWTLQGEAKTQAVFQAVEKLRQIAHALQPFMPATASTLLIHLNAQIISPLTPMFPRIS